MSNSLREQVASTGKIPLSWVSRTPNQPYLNLGDALSPVIVSLLSGLPTNHVAAKSGKTRMAAVGTIGHMFSGGEISFWGTGTSPHLNPSAEATQKLPYRLPQDTIMSVYATRGPFTRKLLAPDASKPGVYGDPLWLLPRFHNAPTDKKYELGVILHLSELDDRNYHPVPKAEHHRYSLSDADKSHIKLINTVTAPTIAALRERLDEILSCKRIVSTSLHGMVFAESYGIPCLYFSPRASSAGIGQVDLDSGEGIDLRFNDLYRGLGQTTLDVWYQPRRKETSWDTLIETIDKSWYAKKLDEDALIEAFPLQLNPMQKGATGSALGHPLINATPTSNVKDRSAPKSWLGKLVDRIR